MQDTQVGHIPGESTPFWARITIPVQCIQLFFLTVSYSWKSRVVHCPCCSYNTQKHPSTSGSSRCTSAWSHPNGLEHWSQTEQHFAVPKHYNIILYCLESKARALMGNLGRARGSLNTHTNTHGLRPAMHKNVKPNRYPLYLGVYGCYGC